MRVEVDERRLASAYAPRRFALVIGISSVRDGTWRPLRFAAKDAGDVARALADPSRGAFTEVSQVTAPEATSRAGVLAAVAALREKATRADDVVVVYLSAHGTLARSERGELRRFLVTHDAELRRIEKTALPIDELKAEFDRLPSRRRLLVLATCHSGSGKSLLPRELEEELSGIKSGFWSRPLEESSRAAMVFSACDWGETAREDEKLENDIYTHFLVDGLGGGADRNGDGAVTATEAHDFARRRTFAFTEGRQRPSAEILEVGADPLVLSGEVERLGRPELYSYSPRLDGFSLKVDGEERAELPGGASVREGKRRIELTKGGSTLLSTYVEVAAGERVELEELLTRATPWRSLSLVGGVMGFVDSKSRAELLPEAPSGGVALRLDGFPSARLSLQLDLALSAGRQSLRLSALEPLPFGYRMVQLGASVPYSWRLGRLSFLAGPRVAGLWLSRSFELEAYHAGQSYLTVSPGLMAGAAYGLSERWELSAQMQLMLTYVVVDGAGQGLGFAGGWAGAGYRF
ncbi:MAG: caspase family protein [Myxococcales bacterium]|nr:caspase family protein [Myxococcales bacterium]